mmetsp:Transcript_60478/g.108972  ORF Transcript_60478/g.108972 Transcript_60478/m.108972 type:complete len:117 (+) Transcript_60478:659-1009(+)
MEVLERHMVNCCGAGGIGCGDITPVFWEASTPRLTQGDTLLSALEKPRGCEGELNPGAGLNGSWPMDVDPKGGAGIMPGWPTLESDRPMDAEALNCGPELDVAPRAAAAIAGPLTS